LALEAENEKLKGATVLVRTIKKTIELHEIEERRAAAARGKE
jgi:hypothetical protein